MSGVGKHLAPPLLVVGLLLAACHPTGVEYVTDLDTVATTRDPNFNFAAPTTYKLPTSIPLITTDDDPTIRPPDELPADLTNLILSTLDTEMTAQGYVNIAQSPSAPDLVVTAAALKVTNISYYYQYWCGYWGFYYSPCYPYYPPVAVSSYVVGSLIVELTPFPADANQGELGAWTAIIRGIQSGNPSTDRARIVNGISQAFNQSSSYLGK